jgi:hypothetical protein
LSALLGNELNTRVGNLEGGSALTVNATGTGNAITSISKAGTVITATKGATFSLSNHLHSTSDITSGIFAIARIPTGTTGTTVALGNHSHTGVYEPTFTKNTAFNKNFGAVAGTVAEGNDSRIINGQTAFGWGNHSGLYLPLTGGTMANTNLVTNLNADLLDGEDSSFFKKRYNVIIKKGTWSRILYATPIALSGSFMVSINYTRYSTVVGNVFLITFGHSGHGQITVLGTHGYTQIQARLTGDANNIYLELFDEGYGTVGDTQTATITLDSINANITTYTSFTDGTTLSGSVKSLVSTVVVADTKGTKF